MGGLYEWKYTVHLCGKHYNLFFFSLKGKFQLRKNVLKDTQQNIFGDFSQMEYYGFFFLIIYLSFLFFSYRDMHLL